MVNLVVRHSSHLQSTMPRQKSLAVTTRHASPNPRDRIVPSPIRVPRQESRPVSPLTTTESLFGNMQNMNRPGYSHSHSSDPSSNRRRALASIEGNHSNGDLVCDYDKSVTPLYETLESSQWDKARLRCRTNPEEVQTWIVRRDASSNIRWKLLPLHAAVIFQAPKIVIECMLKEFPMAAGKRDDQGMLPLHLGFRHKQEEPLLKLLMEQYPSAVKVKDRRDRLPIEHGKDSQFSASFLNFYAEVYAKCYASQATGETNVSADLKSVYEERMDALARRHEQEIREMKLKVEQDQHGIRTQHNQEIDEMRDLLSREVASSQRVSELELEVQDLQSSLAQANQETQVLHAASNSQKDYQKELKSQLQKVLNDQKTLHTFCSQQQEELEQTQQLREQLLRTLLQKEDGEVFRASREMCQLSDNILLRTEQIMNQTSKSPEKPRDNHKAVAENRLGEIDEHRLKGFQEQETPVGWEGGEHENDHGDDISAITEDNF